MCQPCSGERFGGLSDGSSFVLITLLLREVVLPPQPRIRTLLKRILPTCMKSGIGSFLCSLFFGFLAFRPS